MKEKLNILWLFGEDVCPWMSFYGDKTVETPRLNELVRDGVLFANCFAPAGVCSPSRSGIITGCMPTTIGVHQHVSSRPGEPDVLLPEHVATLPQLFRENGYFTFNHGKDDYNFKYEREQLYTGPYETLKFYGHFGQGDWSEREPGQPFFGQIMLWGGKNKKEPAVKVDPVKVNIAPYYPDTREFRDEYELHYNQISVLDEEVGAIVQRLKDEGLYENTILFFFSDHGYRLLRHKQFLYDGGIHVPLIIAAPGNPQLIRPGTVREDLVSSIDVAATSLALAGLPVPEWMESRNVFAGDYHREYIVSARDRCDFTVDRIRAIRTERYKYIRNFMTDRPLMQPQYRDGVACYKTWMRLRDEGKLTPLQEQFVSKTRLPEELYDIVNDPHETINLINDSRYAEPLLELRAILQQWIEDTDDKGQYPEPDGVFVAQMERWGEERCVNPEYDRVRRNDT